MADHGDQRILEALEVSEHFRPLHDHVHVLAEYFEQVS